MAIKSRKQALLFFFLIFTLTQLIMHSCAIRPSVGGRREVKNVSSNKQIQDLGRYCVEQYNLKMLRKGINGSSGNKLLVFAEVVSAETQVVSGIKYYLKISATPHGGGVARDFEAVVLVKPWMPSEEVLMFDPSPKSYARE